MALTTDIKIDYYREMSQEPSSETPLFVVQNVHLSSVNVSRTLAAGSSQLDSLLLSFAKRLLSDLMHPSGPSANFKLRPHVLQVGAPFDEDVQTAAPR